MSDQLYRLFCLVLWFTCVGVLHVEGIVPDVTLST